MEHIPRDDIIQLSISLYKNLGENIHYTSKKAYVYRLLNVVAMLLILIFILANLFHVQGGMYIKTVEGCLTIVHALIKYSLFIHYKDEIKTLLEDMSHFWNFRSMFYPNVKKVYKFSRFTQDFYLVGSITIIVMYSLKPVFNSKNVFLLPCWVPNSIILETVVLFCQYYLMAIIVCLTYSYDSMYLSYSAHVVIQLRLLKHKLQHMTIPLNIREVYDCVKHHQLLLSIFKRMNQVYFWTFLFHYFITLITGCTQLYVILVGKTDIINLAATSVYIIALFFQFGFWSFAVEEIVFELSSIANAIYMSSWYEERTIVRRILLLMMMKAQAQKYMTAGGLMDMNIDTFGSVARKIFSFYAILRNLIKT